MEEHAAPNPVGLALLPRVKNLWQGSADARIGPQPDREQESGGFMDAIQNVLVLHGEATECFGIAPQGDLERGIEATLKCLKIYN